MTPLIPHSRPFVGAEEIRAVRRVIASRHLAQGDEVLGLEREVAEIAGQRHGVAVSSGTAALYLSLRALDIRDGDEVVMPSYVCTALLNAALMARAAPVLADVDPVTGNLRARDVRRVLTRRTHAVIVPHLFGCPAGIGEIAALGVPVIEDCAQCVGTAVNGRPVGSFGALTVFSFYATKLIAAGEGGLVASSDRGLSARVRDLREYDKQPVFSPSFNFKLSDMHAAIARAQLAKLPRMIARRRAIAAAYANGLEDLAPRLSLPDAPRTSNTVCFRFVVRITPAAAPVMRRLRTAGIECGSPIHRPLHHCLRERGFPAAESLHLESLSLPIHPGLSREDAATVVDAVRKFLLRAPR